MSTTRGGVRALLAAIVLASLCINTVGLRWGLPNPQGTWAADALQPMAPLAVAKHGLWSERWNSGWFYFKYPIGHPLLLLAAQLPYLGWLHLRHQFRSPTSEYPYGFRDPERALTVLAVITRLVSAVMGAGLVVLAYVIGAELFGAAAGLSAAVLTAGCYPFVFYAHTSNVDVPVMFWIALALAATLRSARTGSAVAAVLVGAAAALALLTKEQSIGGLAALPLVWLLMADGAQRRWQVAGRIGGIALAGALVVTVFVGNVWWNPSGYLNRWRFLFGTLPAAVRDKYAPYQFQVEVPRGFSVSREVMRMGKIGATVTDALTVPVLALCAAGALIAAWRRPRAAAVVALAAAVYYVLSLRATALIQVRYTMPLLFFLLVFGGVAAAAAFEWARRRRVAAAVVVGLLSLALLPGMETDRLLLHDPRYSAEAWMRQHAPAQAHIEIYQQPTYLPRLGSQWQVERVPVEARAVGAFLQRRPDFIILSSGGHAGLTGHYVRDWHPGMPIIDEAQPAHEFFSRLMAGDLGYRTVGSFHTPSHWIVPRINSLNPQITIFAPDPSVATEAR